MLKTYGDTFAFANYLRTQTLPSQTAFVLFNEAVPRMVKGNSVEEVQQLISSVSLVTSSIIAPQIAPVTGLGQGTGGMWNSEYKAYTYTKKVLGMLNKCDAAFFRRMMNMVFENPDASNPAIKSTSRDKDAMKQKSPIRVTEDEIRRFLNDYAPTLKRQFDQLLSVEAVKDPETTLKIFRTLMNGQNLDVLEMRKPYMDVGIRTDQTIFKQLLMEEYPHEAMPEIYTMEKITGNGTYSYRDDATGKSVSGSAYLERDVWGPTARVAVYGGLSGTGNSTQYTLGSTGQHLNRLGDYDVNYILGLMKSDTVNAEIKADLDAFKDTANTFVHLYVRDEKNTETPYEMTVYRKDGSTYTQVQVYRLSTDKAASIFGGYMDATKDARVLFQEAANGKRKLSLLLGAEVGSVGMGVIKSGNATLDQMSEILTITSPEKKVGLRFYTDGESAKQLGMRVESKKVFADAAAGKEGKETVYGLNFKLKMEKYAVSMIALKHLDKILAGGVSAENAYFLLDHIDNLHGSKDTGVTAGIRVVDKATGRTTSSANLWWYDNGRAANYAYGDGLTLSYDKLMAERKNLMDAMARGDAKGVNDRLQYVNVRIDSLKTIIGDKVTRAFKGTIGNKTLEYVAGDSQFFNMVVYGPKTSWSVNGSTGKVKSAEFNRVGIADAENAAATLLSAAFLSTDDIAAVSGRYGRSSDPNKPAGSGYIAEIRGGKNVAEASAGYYKWSEPFEELKRQYDAIILNAGRNQKNLDRIALGYGKTFVDLGEGDTFSRTYYVIVEGVKTVTADALANVVKAMALEAGIKLAHVQIDKVEKLEGSLSLVKLKGYKTANKSDTGTYFEVKVNGEITRPIY
ncbi:Uncharacterised protein [uncultured archaeon]|nr:Uncharacterised protein [uncultured archaeon]